MNSLTFDFYTEKIRLSGFVCKRPYLLWIGPNQIKDDIEKKRYLFSWLSDFELVISH